MTRYKLTVSTFFAPPPNHVRPPVSLSKTKHERLKLFSNFVKISTGVNLQNIQLEWVSWKSAWRQSHITQGSNYIHIRTVHISWPLSVKFDWQLSTCNFAKPFVNLVKMGAVKPRLYYMKHDVCVTVHHRYSNINSKLDATMTNFIDNYNQRDMFPAIISPILRSTKTVFTTCGIKQSKGGLYNE